LLLLFAFLFTRLEAGGHHRWLRTSSLAFVNLISRQPSISSDRRGPLQRIYTAQNLPWSCSKGLPHAVVRRKESCALPSRSRRPTPAESFPASAWSSRLRRKDVPRLRLARLIFPVPVLLKRLAAPVWVFNLGISSRFWSVLCGPFLVQTGVAPGHPPRRQRLPRLSRPQTVYRNHRFHATLICCASALEPGPYLKPVPHRHLHQPCTTAPGCTSEACWLPGVTEDCCVAGHDRLFSVNCPSCAKYHTGIGRKEKIPLDRTPPNTNTSHAPAPWACRGTAACRRMPGTSSGAICPRPTFRSWSLPGCAPCWCRKAVARTRYTNISPASLSRCSHAERKLCESCSAPAVQASRALPAHPR